tara:strand:- start:51 stop:506 length:456 start_codon:yes stop_codon:yes gene_type:complete
MKNIFFIILLFFLNQCSTSSPEVKIKPCNVKQNFAFEETDPEWFKENDDEEFYYIVKNKEYSGDSKLAEIKNMYISEILLANKIAKDFMSCSDQNSAIKYIRNSKNSSEVQMFKNGQLVTNLNGQFKIERNITIEGNNKFISYLKFKKLKK